MKSFVTANFFAAQFAFAQSDVIVLKRSVHAFAPFGQVPGIQRYATEEEQAGVIQDKRFTLERLPYASGSLPVVAYLYRPPTRLIESIR